jgi:hypothetical protein
MACHLVCVEGGACGMRWGCLWLNLTGLDRFVAASSGAQPQGNRHVAQALVTSRHDDTARLAQDMPHKERTVTPDATCTGGLCLVPMDPESHCMLVEQLAQAREHARGHALMAPALAQRPGRGIPSTRDEAPGL